MFDNYGDVFRDLPACIVTLFLKRSNCRHSAHVVPFRPQQVRRERQARRAMAARKPRQERKEQYRGQHHRRGSAMPSKRKTLGGLTFKPSGINRSLDKGHGRYLVSGRATRRSAHALTESRTPTKCKTAIASTSGSDNFLDIQP